MVKFWIEEYTGDPRDEKKVSKWELIEGQMFEKEKDAREHFAMFKKAGRVVRLWKEEIVLLDHVKLKGEK